MLLACNYSSVDVWLSCGLNILPEVKARLSLFRADVQTANTMRSNRMVTSDMTGRLEGQQDRV